MDNRRYKYSVRHYLLGEERTYEYFYNDVREVEQMELCWKDARIDAVVEKVEDLQTGEILYERKPNGSP